MNTELIPLADPFGIPAPPVIFIFLMNLTLVLHFIMMGYVFTFTLMHIFYALGARDENSPSFWIIKKSETLLPVALSFTITLGIAPLLFVQVLYHQFFYTANILIGYQWFGVILVLMTAFYLIYVVYNGKVFGRRLPAPVHALARLAIFAGVLYIMVTHTANAIVAMYPESWRAVQASGGNFMLANPKLFWPRLTHNAFAALIIGGVWMITLGRYHTARARTELDRAGGEKLIKGGFHIVTMLTAIQLLVGFWLLAALDKEHLKGMMAFRPAMLMFALSFLGVMALPVFAIMSKVIAGKMLPLVGMWGSLLLTLGGMFAARELLRQVRLREYFNVYELKTNLGMDQMLSVVLFLVLFVAALVIIGLMLKWTWAAIKKEQGDQPA